MKLTELGLLYLVVGAACAVAVFRKERRRGPLAAALSALATVALWPLWAPFVLVPPHDRKSPSAAGADAVARIRRALCESVKAVADTPMNTVFTPTIAHRIEAEVERVAARIAELGAVADGCGGDKVASAERLRDLEAKGAPERVVATARLQAESFARLDALRAADCAALDELADLLEALRAQLLVARYAGSSADGPGAIVSEVWARLEGLGVAFESAPAA
jgi:hypothetical protein